MKIFNLLLILVFFSIFIIIFILNPTIFYKKFYFNLKFPLIVLSSSEKIQPKICEKRVWEINLSKSKIYFFDNCKLKKIFPIAYQAPDGKWYQTPTGYFRVGIKKEKHISSLFPVYMNYAVQMYEDFFIHEIPYYLNGQKVDSNFTGGCIRLETDYAQKFFEMTQVGDLIISYVDLNNIKVKNNFIFPVKYNEFYIRQRFNNPLRTTWYSLEDRRIDYIQHAGLDLAPNPNAKDLNVYNIYDGKIAKIVKNGENDHGMGNVIIIEHPDLKIYSLYAHLSTINNNLKIGSFVKKGEILGKVGATGYGCNYWRIGEDGCNKKEKIDLHLHFEIKTKPILESPKPAACIINKIKNKCYGYTPDDPEKYGYYHPLKFLIDK
ncbi:MAG: hypothetical protein KatS3mg095_0215 [Candidatus Parcubacteria bacterium]|nr:MAG: hypothetical protein KatS3mg095_0215 [Candidatus Parcubacteria bacterium]